MILSIVHYYNLINIIILSMVIFIQNEELAREISTKANDGVE